jgi:predicted hotdog family 3-hydroxylacyl-ACP dehydratase
VSGFPPSDKRRISGEELLGLLPHKGKMLLISRLISYDVPARTLCSEFDVDENCLFYDPALGGVPSLVSFEFMAQAVSALSGITGRVRGLPPLMGFILSVSSLELPLALYPSGSTLRVEIAAEQRVGTVSSFHGTVWLGAEKAAGAKLMVMDIEDPAAFMNDEKQL